jgi:hypothetical protein
MEGCVPLSRFSRDERVLKSDLGRTDDTARPYDLKRFQKAEGAHPSPLCKGWIHNHPGPPLAPRPTCRKLPGKAHHDPMAVHVQSAPFTLFAHPFFSPTHPGVPYIAQDKVHQFRKAIKIKYLQNRPRNRVVNKDARLPRILGEKWPKRLPFRPVMTRISQDLH